MVGVMVAELVLQGGFCGRGDGVVVTEILVVGKYCDVIYFLSLVEHGIFLCTWLCNAAVLQLN